MNDDEIIAVLRERRPTCTAVELAVTLGTLASGGLSHSVIMTYFKRAFPAIPLRVLLEAGEWHRGEERSAHRRGLQRVPAPLARRLIARQYPMQRGGARERAAAAGRRGRRARLAARGAGRGRGARLGGADRSPTPEPISPTGTRGFP